MNSSHAKYLGTFLLISIIYSLLWYNSWFLPESFATVGSAANWFLPAGYRFTAFLFIPKRFWLAIILGEWSAIRLITAERGDFAILSDFIATTVPSLVYLCAAVIYLKYYKTPSIKTATQTIALLLSSILSATITATILTTSMIFHNEINTITQNELFTQKHLLNIMVFSFGDIIGVILILPFAILLAETFSKKQSKIHHFNIANALKTLIVISSLYFIATHTSHIPLYYIKIISVSIVIACTYKWGWQGATLSTLVMCIQIVHSSLISTEEISVIENQVYLITIALTALIQGALVSEQRALSQKLTENNSILKVLNEKYKKQAIENQNLAAKVVKIQEEERKKIASNLHDDIGQTLTAIRTEIAILEHVSTNEKVQHCIVNLKKLTGKIYDVTRNLIALLHPREVDDLALEPVLKSKTLTQLLAQAKVRYYLDIEGDVTALSYEKKMAIFRIVQESFNNVVKHADAKNVHVVVSVHQHQLTLSISDDGKGFNAESKTHYDGQLGLLGMKERALALNGNFNISSSSKGTIITLRIPLN